MIGNKKFCHPCALLTTPEAARCSILSEAAIWYGIYSGRGRDRIVA